VCCKSFPKLLRLINICINTWQNICGRVFVDQCALWWLWLRSSLVGWVGLFCRLVSWVGLGSKWTHVHVCGTVDHFTFVVSARLYSLARLQARPLLSSGVRSVQCLSRSCIVSKRVNLFWNFSPSHHSGYSVPSIMAIFPLGQRSRISTNTSLWDDWCNA